MCLIFPVVLSACAILVLTLDVCSGVSICTEFGAQVIEGSYILQWRAITDYFGLELLRCHSFLLSGVFVCSRPNDSASGVHPGDVFFLFA